MGISKETDVVMSLVNPYEQFRNELKEDNDGEVIQVLLTSTRELRKKYHVKDFEAGKPDYTMSTDQNIKDSWNQLKDLVL